MTTLDATLGLPPFSVDRAPIAPSKGARWTGRALSTVAGLFLGFDALMKLLQVAPVIKATVELGYPPSAAFRIGIILALCLVAYAIPRTSILGAVLLTGYLGGAIATHVRVSDPIWTHTLFPVYVAAIVWGGLVLRDGRLRGFLKIWLSR
jgi:hypothetical protein